MAKLLYQNITYKIIGALFETYNTLGYGYQEKYYQRALEEEFRKRKLLYEKELPIKLTYNNTNIGRYFIDFLIEKKIILEIKVANGLYQKDMNQVLAYLKTKQFKLGILAIFSKKGLKYKRIIN